MKTENSRGSHPKKVFCKNGVLKNIAKWTGKLLCHILSSLTKSKRPETYFFIKKRL